MATCTKKNYIAAQGLLYKGNTSAYPNTLIDEQGGLKVTFSPITNIHKSPNLTFAPIATTSKNQNAKLEVVLHENNVANLDIAMPGYSLSGGMLTPSTTLKEYSFRVLAIKGDGTTGRVIYLPRVTPSTTDVAQEMIDQTTDKTTIMATYEVLCPTTGEEGVYIYDYTPKTVADATFAYAPTTDEEVLLVSGEGAAADTLATITGGASGDIITVRAASSDQAITITDTDMPAAGTIQLTGTATDLILSDERYWVRLQRDATSWTEVDRFDGSYSTYTA